jgi:CRISPR-associated protein Cas2
VTAVPDVVVMVLYDISDDRTRLRLIEHLEYLGLNRIQFSVFQGTVPKARVPQIVAGSRAICTDRQDRVLVVPLCASCVRRIVSIHNDREDPGRDGLVV